MRYIERNKNQQYCQNKKLFGSRSIGFLATCKGKCICAQSNQSVLKRKIWVWVAINLIIIIRTKGSDWWGQGHSNIMLDNKWFHLDKWIVKIHAIIRHFNRFLFTDTSVNIKSAQWYRRGSWTLPYEGKHTN